MTLALVASQNAMALSEETGLTPEEIAELQGEMDFVRDVLPIWRFNGNQGRYVNKTDLKDKSFNPEEWPKAISIVILAIAPSQALLRTDAQKESNEFAEVMLCWNNDKVTGHPKINPKLPPEQQQKLAARGAGKDCKTCILGRPKPQGTEGSRRPDCNDGLRMLVWSRGDIFILNIGGMSKSIFDRFLGEHFKSKGLPTIALEVIMGNEFKNDPAKNQSYYLAVPSIGEMIPKGDWRAFMDLRNRYRASFEATDLADEPEMPATSEQPQGQAQAAPEAPKGTFLGMDENGNAVFGDSKDEPPADDEIDAF